MKRVLIISILIGLFHSCNDGDIIITDFNFESTNLKTCGGIGSYVFYNINNSAAAESISLTLETSELLFLESSEVEYVLNGSTYTVDYRKYNGDIDDDYFCSNIPPTSPTVNKEYIGASGVAVLKTTANKDDEDGIEEDVTSDLDTDNDGLLNFFDYDDDGDNVPTEIELGPDFLEGIASEPLDTDMDGIFDYLDEDDDNDTILTRYEDANGDLDPTNDFSGDNDIPDYLNSTITNSNIIDQYKVHSFKLKSDIELYIENLVLVSGAEEITKETMIFGSQSGVINEQISLTPDFN